MRFVRPFRDYAKLWTFVMEILLVLPVTLP